MTIETVPGSNIHCLLIDPGGGISVARSNIAKPLVAHAFWLAISANAR